MDVPTPYRSHFFNSFREELAPRRISLEVAYLAHGVSTRYWGDSRPQPKDYKATFHKALKWHLGDTVYHLNPGLILKALMDRPRFLLLGGAWSQPTVAMLLFACKVFRSDTTVLLWSEANSKYSRYVSGPVALIRRHVVGAADAFVVPGTVSRDTITSYGLGSRRRVIVLPNLVDENLYRDQVARLKKIRLELRRKWGIGPQERVLLWPARLEEKTKGILNFLRAVSLISPPTKVRIVLAGEGPDRPKIEAWLRGGACRFQVGLVGWRSQPEMLELYALADALLLPSLADPNPLSVVEALWAGLPILMSDRCGNWPEAVGKHGNGWVVDPADAQGMGTAFLQLVGLSSPDLERMGLRSGHIAEQSFSTRSSVSRFVSALELLPADKQELAASNLQ